ncbi:HepT-like ribonuclease domain-containing protein [Microcoleus sp. B9-D4]|uniref:HepT-like ribonuclease domain-containing protein n=1 Tax=Microcoleus sp. B9-D4 TaxID=2818711 RepID=UPI002FD4DE58
MQAGDRDSASLWDMAQAIRRIQEFTANASSETYLESVFMQSAVERQLGILGEASRRVSIDFQQFHPEIDWRNAINLRNILVHRYDQVRPEVIWNIVTSVWPSLLVQIEALLPPLPDDI